MAWVKRNLFFLIGSVIALALLGAAGFYLFTKNKLNTELSEKLDAEYGELNQLNAQSPHPGNAKVDNIKAAREQQKELHTFIARSGKFFDSIPPIPNVDGANGITDKDSHEFASALRDTIKQMQRDATAASVTLPPNYDFSFSAIKSKITFATGSLQPLSAQLGEVKALCDVLFHAKINSLDSLRRERVSPDDKEMADYTELQSVTNDLAVLTPYEITLHCFSSELAGVLSGLASSPYAFIVKSLGVDSTGAAMNSADPNALGNIPAQPAYVLPPAVGEGNMRVSQPPGGMPQPGAAVPPGRGGLQTVLNERPLKINLVIELVKLRKATN